MIMSYNNNGYNNNNNGYNNNGYNNNNNGYNNNVYNNNNNGYNNNGYNNNDNGYNNNNCNIEIRFSVPDNNNHRVDVACWVREKGNGKKSLLLNVYGCVWVKGCSICYNKNNEPFISFPAFKNNKGDFVNLVTISDKTLKSNIINEIMKRLHNG